MRVQKNAHSEGTRLNSLAVLRPRVFALDKNFISRHLPQYWDLATYHRVLQEDLEFRIAFLGYVDENHSSVVARAVVHSSQGQRARSLSHV